MTNDSLHTKCKSCGGVMHYSPAAENLQCLYCNSIVDIDKSPAVMKSNDFSAWKERAQSNETVEAVELKCRQCGASTTMPANVTGAKCAFCGTPSVISDAAMRRFWPPEYLLPFKITEKQSGANFTTWLRKKWFAPSKLRKNAIDTDAFKGVYLPFWIFDADTVTDYKGERGVDRKDEYVKKDGTRASRTVTQWYQARGSVAVQFRDLMVHASKTLPDDISMQLTQWDMENCVTYRKEFLAGFVTEIYQRDVKASFDDAKQKMTTDIDSAIRRDIGGDRQRVGTKHTEYEELKFRHMLFPVWMSAFKFNNKLYQFVVNGRNGKVVGQYPKSTLKIVLTVVALVLVIGTVLAVVWPYLSDYWNSLD
jgi:ribosomal protein L37E